MANVLVTGASGGIGSAIMRALEASGHNVVPSSRSDTDVTDEAALARLRMRVSHVDWIVCAHGFIDAQTALEKQEVNVIRDTFSVNAISLFLIAREFLSSIPAGGGMVVISSSAGVVPNGRFAAYSASKAAANAFVQGMARYRPDARFYSVAPGPTNTAMRERVAHDAAHMQHPDVVAALVRDLIDENTEYRSGDVILIKNGVHAIASRV